MNTTTRQSPLGRPLGKSSGEQDEAYIPLSVPAMSGREREYLDECVTTNFVSSVGPFVERFERALASFVGTRHATATVNGTAALHVALLVAGVRPDDEVLVSTLTFIAPVNAIRYVGAWPVFIDAEPVYWQMDPDRVRAFVEEQCEWVDGRLRNKVTQRRVSAILPVHILGHPCDMDPLIEIARKYSLVVIEDATESLGAKYKGRMVGHIADVACLSFNGNKLLTTGGGGMVLTDDEAWARRAAYLTTQAKDDPFEFVHEEIGFNYRLTNVQAALGCAQFEQLPHHVNAKRRIADTYARALGSIPGIVPMPEAPWASNVFWLYTVLVQPEVYGMDSRALSQRLQARRVQTRPLWQPIHVSPAHRQAQRVSCPVAERLNREAISLPCSVGLTASEQDRVIELVRQYQAGQPSGR